MIHNDTLIIPFKLLLLTVANELGCWLTNNVIYNTKNTSIMLVTNDVC